MSKLYLEIDEKTLTQLILSYISEQYGINEPLDTKHVSIMVKSKQNYRSEWEKADFKAVIEKQF